MVAVVVDSAVVEEVSVVVAGPVAEEVVKLDFKIHLNLSLKIGVNKVVVVVVVGEAVAVVAVVVVVPVVLAQLLKK